MRKMGVPYCFLTISSFSKLLDYEDFRYILIWYQKIDQVKTYQKYRLF